MRLNPTPEQWDPVPAFVGRIAGTQPNQIVVASGYPAAGLNYRVEVDRRRARASASPSTSTSRSRQSLVGKAGFNLDFLPTAYFGKAYLMVARRVCSRAIRMGPMTTDGSGDPLAARRRRPFDHAFAGGPATRVTIVSDKAPLALYDARNRAQNGWFVVRSLIAAGATTNAVVWHVRPNIITNWVRQPVVSYNQAGYTPARSKVAVIELDPNFKAPAQATLVKLTADGVESPVLTANIKPWGKWLRYNYATFDFSTVRDAGALRHLLCRPHYRAFRDLADAYDRIWQTSLDTYLAEQMDHMRVREQYRIWQGVSAPRRRAPGAAQHRPFRRLPDGPKPQFSVQTGRAYSRPDVGGWQDAGDYDIQTPQQRLCRARPRLGARAVRARLGRDHRRRGSALRANPQARRGAGFASSRSATATLQLLAQYKVFGHAIVGIVDPTLQQYTHLGDAGSQTDGRLYDPRLGTERHRGR